VKTPAIALLAADPELPQPVAAGWQPVLAVGQTIKTWSLMETVLSVVGLVFVLLLGLVIRPGQRAVSS
jgi:GntP family permease